MAEGCECPHPLGAPERSHWWPYRDPDPVPDVRVAVRYGDDLGTLRMVGERHPVLDATGRLDAEPATHTDETGVSEAAIAARHAALVADLGGVLDTEAGLNAIVEGRCDQP